MGIFNFLRQMPEKITDANTLSQVNILCFYVAESASGKIKEILYSDWLPEQARWVHVARSGFPALIPQVIKVLLAT